MADPSYSAPSDSTTPSDGGTSHASNKRKTRGATKLKNLSLARAANERVFIEFDEVTGKVKKGDPKKSEFSSFVAATARQKIGILFDDWKHVLESDKDLIWQQILLTFTVPNTSFLKNKWISYAGERWSHFKTRLSSEYIYGEKKNKNPCEDFDFLDEETWRRFVAVRTHPEFEEKRRKGKDIQKNNVYLHRLSRGGYEKLGETTMQEKLQNMQQTSQLDPDIDLDPPSPPKRHELWKRARIKPTGEYTSEGARNVAETIDSLVESSTQGSFVPEGRLDILTVAIGKPEHPGRVRVAGRGVGIRQYYKNLSRSFSQSSVSKEDLTIMENRLRDELKREFAESMRKELASLALSQQNIERVVPHPHVSAKESCASLDPPTEGMNIDKNKFRLYVDGDPPHLVAIGVVYNLGPNIHHQKIDDNMVRVVVEEVLDAKARVPMPTDEVQTVGQAPKNFVLWPTKLVQSMSSEDVGSNKKVPTPRAPEPENEVDRLWGVARKLGKGIVEVPMDKDVYGVSSPLPLHICQQDVLEICTGNVMLNIMVIQFWILYLHRLCTDKGLANVYGFMDPFFLQTIGNKRTSIQAYMQRRLNDSKKQCYLVPYLDSSHWQLIIICPKDNIVVLLCSLNNKKAPNKEIKAVIDTAMDSYQRLEGWNSTIRKKPSWILPQCAIQPGSYECGYYVMRHMFTIISAGISHSWKEIFNDRSALQEDEIEDIRQRWTKFFFEYYKL